MNTTQKRPRPPLFPAFLLPQGTVRVSRSGVEWKVVQWGPYVGTTSWNQRGVSYRNPDGTVSCWG